MEQLSKQEQNHIQNLQEARLKTERYRKKTENTSKKQTVKANFPFLMLFIALLKDATDFIPFAGFIMTPLFYLCVFFWFILKDSKLIHKNSVKNIIGGSSALFVDLVPGLDFLPEATLFVLFVYFNEKTLAKNKK